MTYGVTPQGFKIKRLPEVKSSLEDNFIAEFGEINLEAQSVTGQIIGIFSKVFADDWENLEDVYFSQYPNSASGISLDNAVQLIGITRLPAEKSFVIGAATGIEGTFLAKGRLAKLLNTQHVFESTQDVIISRGTAIQVKIQVSTPELAQKYKVILSGKTFLFSLPNIDFSAPIVAGNTIKVRVNGIESSVSFATDSDTTLVNLLNTIIASSSGAVAPVGVTALDSSISGNSIFLTPSIGYSVDVNSLLVIGAGAPTYTESFRTTFTTAQIAQYLAEVIDASNNYEATQLSPNTIFQVRAEDTTKSFSVNLSTGLAVTEITSPVSFLAQEYGPIPVPANTLTEILTPVAGWTTLTNFDAGVTGRDEETDAELRLRFLSSRHIVGAATVEAIRARLLQEVPGVTGVVIFENVTMVVDGSGRPPKSFETIVEGGSDDAVALKIWQTKPAGIETFGNTPMIVIDSQGNNQPINFSRAVPIYIWVDVVIILNPQETFPVDGLQRISEAILQYGNSLGIGVDVFYQRVLSQVFSVPGVANAVVQISGTATEIGPPIYASADIDIGETEVSSWVLSRISVGF